MFIHFSVEVYLGCFHFLACANHVAITSSVQAYGWTNVFVSLRGVFGFSSVIFHLTHKQVSYREEIKVPQQAKNFK